jgi:hypothetical protein
MGSSLTGLDTSFSSGREFWSSWQLDCSQPGGRVPRNRSNVCGPLSEVATSHSQSAVRQVSSLEDRWGRRREVKMKQGNEGGVKPGNGLTFDKHDSPTLD